MIRITIHYGPVEYAIVPDNFPPLERIQRFCDERKIHYPDFILTALMEHYENLLLKDFYAEEVVLK